MLKNKNREKNKVDDHLGREGPIFSSDWLYNSKAFFQFFKKDLLKNLKNYLVKKKFKKKKEIIDKYIEESERERRIFSSDWLYNSKAFFEFFKFKRDLFYIRRYRLKEIFLKKKKKKEKEKESIK